jgi:hypothetical protein
MNSTLIDKLIADYDHPWPNEDAATKAHRESLLAELSKLNQQTRLVRLGNLSNLRQRVAAYEALNNRSPDVNCLPNNQSIIAPTKEEQSIIDLYATELRKLQPGSPAETT